MATIVFLTTYIVGKYAISDTAFLSHMHTHTHFHYPEEMAMQRHKVRMRRRTFKSTVSETNN